MNDNKTVVTLFASDFSVYGKVQAIKSTLQYLARSNGHRFVFVNDPKRGDEAKIRVVKGSDSQVLITKEFNPKQLNEIL